MRAFAFVVSLLVIAPTARAVDGMSVVLGTSDSSYASVDMVRIGVQWNWSKRWALGQNWHIGGYWELDFGYWSNDSPRKTNNGMTDIGFTPTFRLQQNSMGAFSPYVEGAIGFHLLSDTSVSEWRRFSTKFQFGEHLGLGIRFGHKHAMDLGYRYQHLSNAGIKHPNHGIEFHQVRFQYHY
ncbi:MAG: acyloxyacyl hydrolase [Betaproteobacteria bacterium]|nr:MAG: acyloxyacyl hydrolase [Betaproteobacteria bacterium]